MYRLNPCNRKTRKVKTSAKHKERKGKNSLSFNYPLTGVASVIRPVTVVSCSFRQLPWSPKKKTNSFHKIYNIQFKKVITAKYFRFFFVFYLHIIFNVRWKKHFSFSYGINLKADAHRNITSKSVHTHDENSCLQKIRSEDL